MSALQASRRYKVPSRTLYDKVKKLGIVGARPMNRAIKRSPSNGSPASFPYGISGTRSPLSHQLEGQSHSQSLNENENGGEAEQRERKPPLSLLDPTNFLLQAFSERGSDFAEAFKRDVAARGADNAGREAFVAFVANNGMKNLPGVVPMRSPSPNSTALMKYMQGQQASPSNNNSGSEQDINRHREMSQSPPLPYQSPMETAASPARSAHDDDDNDDESFNEKLKKCAVPLLKRGSFENTGRSIDEDEDDDQVEDLSMSRKESSEKLSPPPSPVTVSVPNSDAVPPPTSAQQLGVIVPPRALSPSAQQN